MTDRDCSQLSTESLTPSDHQEYFFLICSQLQQTLNRSLSCCLEPVTHSSEGGKNLLANEYESQAVVKGSD